tara:strand:- start:371 stop:616 length:246 start_codon:yes stop_codon:yes gene_type:complete
MKKFIFTNINSLLINIFLVFFLLFAIQNSQEKKVTKIFNKETVELPISFILGTSFIAGSISGNFIFSILVFKNKSEKDKLI